MEFLQYFFVMYIYMLSPGPSMALISRNSAKFGISYTFFTILGINCSIALYTLLSVLGIATIINVYPNAFKLIKIIGSCYILFLGVRIVLNAFKVENIKMNLDANKLPPIKQFLIGLTTDLANPLSFVGITSVILGFVNQSDSTSTKLAYAGVTIVCGFAYAYTYAFLFGNKISRKFISPKMNLFEKIAGTLVAIIGIIFLINSIKL